MTASVYVRGCILMLVLCMVVVDLFAQSIPKRFGSLEDVGLVTYTIEALYQDSQGFVWIGTQGGLNRYDGAEMRLFQPVRNNPNSLSGVHVQTIIEKPIGSGIIWVGTQGDGLNQFDPISETFTRFQQDSSSVTALSHNDVTSLFVDSQDRLWVGTMGGGLQVFIDSSQTFTRVPNEGNSEGGNAILDIAELPALPGWLWIATVNGLYLVDADQLRFLRRWKPQLDLTSCYICA